MDAEHNLQPDQPAPPITEPTVHDKWAWPYLVAALDKAGYRIVKKPELQDRGRPAARK